LSEALVFDSGPLSHFAEAGWLNILKSITGARTALIPEVVREEISDATYRYPFLSQVLEADWIKIDRSDDVNLLVVQAR